jgi:hypothetical protein
MSESDWQADLTEMLVEKGHSENEIHKIIQRVKEYESELQIDSVMDSIDAGRFDLSAIIKEALEAPD